MKDSTARIQLTQPVCTSADEKIALSRRVEKHWRCVGRVAAAQGPLGWGRLSLARRCCPAAPPLLATSPRLTTPSPTPARAHPNTPTQTPPPCSLIGWGRIKRGFTLGANAGVGDGDDE